MTTHGTIIVGHRYRCTPGYRVGDNLCDACGLPAPAHPPLDDVRDTPPPHQGEGLASGSHPDA